MPDRLDGLIHDAITEKMNEIPVAAEDIELGWSKLQSQMKRNKKSSFTGHKRAAIIVVGVISSMLMMNIFTTIESGAWQKLNFINIFRKEEAITINISSTLVNTPNIEDNTILTNIEEARNLVPYKIKELPFEADEVLIDIIGPVHVVDITYDNERILFRQQQAGIENKQSINLHPDSEVEEITINGQNYILAIVAGRKGLAVWSDERMNYTINFNYGITTEEIVEILKAMD